MSTLEVKECACVHACMFMEREKDLNVKKGGWEIAVVQTTKKKRETM